MDTSQAYFWARVWQADERVAVAELARGEGRRFDDVDAALAWLESPDG